MGGEAWGPKRGQGPREQPPALQEMQAEPMASSVRRREDEAVARELGLDMDWLRTRQHTQQDRARQADTR